MAYMTSISLGYTTAYATWGANRNILVPHLSKVHPSVLSSSGKKES